MTDIKFISTQNKNGVKGKMPEPNKPLLLKIDDVETKGYFKGEGTAVFIDEAEQSYSILRHDIEWAYAED